MSVTIKWLNINVDTLTNIKIYRSDTKGGAVSLLATVPPTDTIYVDNTANDNTVYYYYVDGVIGDDVTHSNIIPMANFPNSGPGPITLLRGDWEFGYFGEVDPATLPAFTDMRAAASSITPLYTATLWMKWVIGGRIVFIPNNWYRLNVTVASGTDFGKLLPADNADRIATGATLSFGDQNYLARLLYGTTKFTTEINPNNEFGATAGSITAVDETFKVSEVAALIASTYVITQISLLNKSKYSDFYPGIVTGQKIITGTKSSINHNIAFSMNTITDSNLSEYAASTIGGLWPVLELLP